MNVLCLVAHSMILNYIEGFNWLNANFFAETGDADYCFTLNNIKGGRLDFKKNNFEYRSR